MGIIFIHPAFLWGLLAVLIPVAIHLFNFRRYRKVYFSNVDALTELQSESRRRSEVRRWLVLAARVLAVALLVLAFAGPVIPGRGSTMQSGATVVSIYIDNTYSMEGIGTDGSQLEMARLKARQVASAYGSGDRYQLLTADMTGQQMRWLSRDELLSAIDEVQPSPTVRTLAEAAARQLTFMAQSGAANRHAYIISDFQRSTSALDALPTDSMAHFTLIPLTGTLSDNIFIDTVRFDAPAWFVGGSAVAEVTLCNGGGADVEKVPVRLYVDGHERAIATVDLAAGATGKALLPFSIDGNGWLEGRVEIADYPVTFDDNYYFAINVDDRLAVHEVDGRNVNSHLQRLFGNDSLVAYRHTQQLSQREVMDADLVILNEPRHLASGDADWLAQWVVDGGSLLVIPSADVRVEELNVMLAALHAPQLGRWVDRRSRAARIDFDNALYRGVFSSHSDEMELPSASGHYLCTGQAVSQSVIALADGGDMLSVTHAGEGRLYLLTMPLDAEHTDIVSQALVVPTLYNMALYSRPQPVPCHTLGDGDPIALTQRYDMAARPPELKGEGVSLIPDVRSVGGRQVLVPHGELRTAGIYALDDERLAFNYGRRESRLDFMTPDEVAAAIEGHEGYSMLSPTARPLDQVLHERAGGHRLWRLCLVLALLALAAEVALIKLKK